MTFFVGSIFVLWGITSTLIFISDRKLQDRLFIKRPLFVNVLDALVTPPFFIMLVIMNIFEGLSEAFLGR